MKYYVTFCLQVVLLTSFCNWTTDLAITWDVHSCLFRNKTSNKEEWGDHAHSLSALLVEQRLLYNNLSRHIKERQNGIYCLNFLKQLNDLFGTHAYQTERHVPKILGRNTCTATPLLYIHFRVYVKLSWQQSFSIGYMFMSHFLTLQVPHLYCQFLEGFFRKKRNKLKVLWLNLTELIIFLKYSLNNLQK